MGCLTLGDLRDMGFLNTSLILSRAAAATATSKERIQSAINFKRTTYPVTVKSFPYSITSDSDGSLFKPGAYDPDQKVTIITGIEIEGKKFEITVPIKELMIPFEDLNGMAVEAKERVIANRAALVKSAEDAARRVAAAEGPVFGSRNLVSPEEVAWRIDNGVPDISGMFDYRGFGLIAEQTVTAIYGSLTAKNIQRAMNSTIKGKVSITLPDGTALGDLTYYWITPSIGTAPGGTSTPFGIPTLTISRMRQAQARRDASFSPLQKDSRFDKANLKEFVDIFSDLWQPEPGRTVTSVKALNNAFHAQYKYLPAQARKSIEQYYDLKDPNTLVDEGWDPASAENEVIQRATLRAKFPLDKMKDVWIGWVASHDDRISSSVNAHAPTAASKIFELIVRTPLGQGLAFTEAEFKAMIDRLKKKYPAGIPSDVLSQFRATLSRVMSEIEQRELQAFNYTYFIYIAGGGMPSAMVNTAVARFNKQQEDRKERAKKQGLIFNIVTLAVSAIPVVGVGFATVMQLANASSNYQQLKSEAKKVEQQEERVEEELEEARQQILTAQQERQEQIVVAQQTDLVEEKKSTKKAARNIGLAAAGTVGLVALVNALT